MSAGPRERRHTDVPAGTPRSQDDGASGVTPIDRPCDPATQPCPQNTGKTLDVGRAQLTVGLAWHYKEYQKEQSEEDRHRYAFAEQEARARKVGLWSEPDPTPPSDWRHGNLGGPTKKATKSGICHAPGTASYSSVKNFTKFPTLDACLASGGRLPKTQK